MAEKGEPFDPPDVRKRVRVILDTGTVTYSKPHALERLQKRSLTMLDCENVLRGGVVAPGEWEHGGWRYHVSTAKITVVVQFLADDHLLIVTAWRNR